MRISCKRININVNEIQFALMITGEKNEMRIHSKTLKELVLTVQKKITQPIHCNPFPFPPSSPPPHPTYFLPHTHRAGLQPTNLQAARNNNKIKDPNSG